MFIRKRFGSVVGSRRRILRAVGVAVVATVFCVGCGNPAGNSGGGKGGGGGDPDSTGTPFDGYTGSYGSVSYGGKTYKTVKIGTQTWFAENLNYNVAGSKCYGEGGVTYVYDEASDDFIEGKTLTASEVQANCAKYGRLYDWNTAMNGASSSSSVPSGVRGVCPSGWHLPSEAEWDVLVDYAGGWETAGTKLKSSSGWYSYDGVPVGTNQYGFSALPGGLVYGYFEGAGNYGAWWTATGDDEYGPMGLFMKYHDESVHVDDDDSIEDIKFSMSVRCVKN